MMMKIILSTFTLLFCLSLSGQFTEKQSIDSLLADQFPLKEEPGFTVGVARRGQLVYQAQKGLANLEYDTPFNSETVVSLASITKQFTAACIAILQHQKQLSLDDDVRKFIPELRFYGDTIRIRHLLNHSSGIRNHNVLLDLQGFDYEHRGYTNEMIQDLMFQQKEVNNAPGEKVLYSNTNYVLLALIVERVSGRPLHEFAKAELFDVLNMKHTFYAHDLEQVIKNRAYPYYQQNGVFKQPKSLTLCIGAGGVGSTLADIAKWSAIFLKEHSAFSFLKAFFSTVDPLTNNGPTNCGRGVFISEFNGYSTILHGGRGLGMRAQIVTLPELETTVFVYTNSEHINAENIAYQILDLMVPKSTISVESQQQKKHQHTRKELEEFSTTYQELNSDLKMSIIFERDTLWSKSSFGQQYIPLAADGMNEFHRQGNENVRYSFHPQFSPNADLLVNFGGATFYLEKIVLDTSSVMNLKEFTGTYFSEELNVPYSISVVENKLTLSIPNYDQIFLSKGRRDEFGSGNRTRYRFLRDEKGEVYAFTVAAEGTVKNILFKKVH